MIDEIAVWGHPPPGGDAELVAVVEGMSRLMATADQAGFAVPDILQALCENTGRELGAVGAGVSYRAADGRDFVHAVPQSLVSFACLHGALDSGPGRASHEIGAPVVVDDLVNARSWPELAAGAAAAGLRSMIAVPVVSRTGAGGVLGLYRSTEQAWSDTELAVARLYADLATWFIDLAQSRPDVVTVEPARYPAPW